MVRKRTAVKRVRKRKYKKPTLTETTRILKDKKGISFMDTYICNKNGEAAYIVKTIREEGERGTKYGGIVSAIIGQGIELPVPWNTRSEKRAVERHYSEVRKYILFKR